MKILFCSPIHSSKKLGTSKVFLELAEEFELLGWHTKVLDPFELCPELKKLSGIEYQKHYSKALRAFLQEYSSLYDVIEYDHLYLPYKRSEFSSSTLMVARSQLLVHHHEQFPIPVKNCWKNRASALLKQRYWKEQLRRWIENATQTIHQSDLINVNNDSAKLELITRGVPPEKIISLPLGISDQRLSLFNSIPKSLTQGFYVVFIGTFDPRKGSNDFPRLVTYILRSIPEAKFRFLGTHNITKPELIKHFPKKYWQVIEVVPTFEPDQLPQLLSNCSVGIFPSYLEGFGLGILEMLAAGIPVISYNCPGPSMMLSNEYLVGIGDVEGMAKKVIYLLSHSNQLLKSQKWAKEKATSFKWNIIASATSDFYVDKLTGIRQLLLA